VRRVAWEPVGCYAPDGNYVVTAQAPGYSAAQASANLVPIVELPCCQQPTTVTIALSH
jgi:hypothetical protein